MVGHPVLMSSYIKESKKWTGNAILLAHYEPQEYQLSLEKLTKEIEAVKEGKK